MLPPPFQIASHASMTFTNWHDVIATESSLPADAVMPKTALPDAGGQFKVISFDEQAKRRSIMPHACGLRFSSASAIWPGIFWTSSETAA